MDKAKTLTNSSGKSSEFTLLRQHAELRVSRTSYLVNGQKINAGQCDSFPMYICQLVSGISVGVRDCSGFQLAFGIVRGFSWLSGLFGFSVDF